MLLVALLLEREVLGVRHRGLLRGHHGEGTSVRAQLPDTPHLRPRPTPCSLFSHAVADARGARRSLPIGPVAGARSSGRHRHRRVGRISARPRLHLPRYVVRLPRRPRHRLRRRPRVPEARGARGGAARPRSRQAIYLAAVPGGGACPVPVRRVPARRGNRRARRRLGAQTRLSRPSRSSLRGDRAGSLRGSPRHLSVDAAAGGPVRPRARRDGAPGSPAPCGRRRPPRSSRTDRRPGRTTARRTSGAARPMHPRCYPPSGRFDLAKRTQ